jgi:hypothetical protein
MRSQPADFFFSSLASLRKYSRSGSTPVGFASCYEERKDRESVSRYACGEKQQQQH